MKRPALSMLLSALFIICAPFMVAAQQSNAPVPQAQTQPAAQPNAATNQAPQQANADENFELNITEKRITEENFAASTQVEAGEESARGLRLRVGVGVGAEKIEVLLRNVRGRVRFRATLDRVLDLINSRTAP